ncbi:MAG: hypothetical protein RBT69_08075 [Spirochaetia bacterium]|jgi:metal-sulfur cluster biosynthetic enzyme|nr:hypothetical protein [Spirochaetia bacterium]
MITEDMKKKIDSVLDNVKEPETFRTVSELNLVKKVTYSESQKKLLVQTDIGEPRSTCMVCSIVNETLRQSIMRDLKNEFDKYFPDLDVEVI